LIELVDNVVLCRTQLNFWW